MKFKLSAIMTAAVLSSGCASMIQQNSFDDFEKNLLEGNSDKLIETVEGKAEGDILWSLQAGAVMRNEGQYKRSNFHFDNAEKIMKEEDTEGLINEAMELGGSMIVNDAILDYEQSHYDGVMTNTYKALNFMAIGDMDSARIEFNRAEDRQRRAATYFKSEIKEKQLEKDEENQDTIDQSLAAVEKEFSDLKKWKAYDGYINPFTTYMNAIFLMTNGNDKSDYNKAADSLKRVYGITKNPSVKVDLQMAKSLAKGKSSKNTVWVVFENGLSAVKEEKRIDVPVFLFSKEAGKNVAYTGIALPKMKDRSVSQNSIKINGHPTQTISDMNKIIKAEFSAEFPYILTREVTRAVVKTVIQKQVADSDGLLGGLTAFAQAATTSADIRMQTTLPENIQITRFHKTGDTLKVEGLGETFNVELTDEHRNHIVYIKSVSAMSKPTVQIIGL